MPPVLPFAGLRYAAPSEELARLICPPFDVISPEEQAQLLATSAHNAVRLELPEDELGKPGSRYATAATRLHDWREQEVLKRDAQPAYYLCETEFSFANATQRRRDVLAAVAVEPWSARVALPHEHTMSAPKADRLALFRATHLTASPIWLIAREQPAELLRAWDLAESHPPTLELTWRDERHR